LHLKIKITNPQNVEHRKTKTRPRLARLQDQDQDQNRSGVKPLPSECMSYKLKTVWQTTASSSI